MTDWMKEARARCEAARDAVSKETIVKMVREDLPRALDEVERLRGLLTFAAADSKR